MITTFTKSEAIAELQILDGMYDRKGQEARFWDNEYRLAGTASTYVKASDKPSIEARYQKARDEQEVIWGKMVELMDAYGIGADDL
jgi:hypothetical protein